MNCGIPTASAASRPFQSMIVALRSFDWLRIGVVAVRETWMAISNAIVSRAPRITSAVIGSTAGIFFARGFGLAAFFFGRGVFLSVLVATAISYASYRVAT